MTFDTQRSEVVLFGGHTGYSTYADTWRWNGATWSLAVQPSSPPARELAGAAFDRARGQMVIFGGSHQDNGGAYNDTWTWNGTRWTKATPAISPPQRYRHAMAYDPVRSVVVLFSGYYNGFVTPDTWTWNGTTWTNVTPGSTSPPARMFHALAWDETRQSIMLFGGRQATQLGDTWHWNGSAWSQDAPSTSPSARSFHAMATDEARRNVVLFGGYDGTSDTDDTWIWDGSNWNQWAPANAPAKRDSHAMAFDGAHGKVALFGGYRNGLDINDTWWWDGVDWSQGTRDAPPARGEHSMVFDTTRNEMLLFAGYAAGTQDFGDLWRLYRTGGTCATSADCLGGLSCVDGVCCATSSCGPCETCAGLTPGACSLVQNREDKNSCAIADGKSCDAAASPTVRRRPRLRNALRDSWPTACAATRPAPARAWRAAPTSSNPAPAPGCATSRAKPPILTTIALPMAPRAADATGRARASGRAEAT